MLTLITGGARSGKSRFAQSLCAGSRAVTYIATARAEDAEMKARIEAHRQGRPGHWTTLEEPLALAEAVQSNSGKVILIDCLTLWLSNLFFVHRQQNVTAYAADLILATKRASVIAVTNEVGQGIVPESSLGREFRDAQGFLNQQMAAAADTVYLLVCGLPLAMKTSLHA